MATNHSQEDADMAATQGSRSPKSIAARAGRWSAEHRKTAIFGWLAFVLVAFALGSVSGMKSISDEDLGNGESGRADKAIAQAFPTDASETVLVQSTTKDAGDAEFRAVVNDAVARIQRADGVRDLRSPLARGNQGQLSPDRHSALVEFEIAGDEKLAEKRVDATLAATAAAQRKHPGFTVEQFGDASAGKAISKSFEDDFKRAETLSLPITLLILVLAFGALVAAAVPLLLALSAVGATIGLVGVMSNVLPVDESISSVILLIGLAVGVDYTMFYLRREREERAKGRSPREALEVAAATSGRAVLVSGLTVMIAIGRHAAHRQRDVLVVRRRHDDRGRGRDDRLAHGAAGRARMARRPRREGPRTAVAAARPRRRLTLLGRDPGPRAAPAEARGAGLRSRAGGAHDPGVRHAHRTAWARHLPARPGRDEDLRQDPEGVPGAAQPGRRRDRGPRRDRVRGPGRHREAA
jgi:hypothetical protein